MRKLKSKSFRHYPQMEKNMKTIISRKRTGGPNKHLRRPMTTQVGRPWERNVALRVAGGICRFQTLGSQA